MRINSVIHEFMHTLVHPVIEQEISITSRKKYPTIDDFYYLDGSGQGYRNAFEEYAVRMLIDTITQQGEFPDLHTYLEQLEEDMNHENPT